MSRTIKYVFTISCLALCAGLLLKGSVPQVLTGTWGPAVSMTQARSGAAASLLDDGRILITGGEDADGVLVDTELFDTNGAFSPASPMGTPRSRHTAVVLQDGRVLVTGGSTSGGGATNAVEIYDPVSNAWSPGAGSLTEARIGHTASLLKDGRVLVVGGENGGMASSTIEIFNPAANSSSFSGMLSSPREAHAATVLPDGKVLIAGGSNGSTALASMEIYDPETGSISAAPGLSIPRAGLSATTLLDGKVLLAGGNDGSNDLASAEIYDPETGTVTALASTMSAPRSQHQAFLLPHNNGVLIVGGISNGAELPTAELFIPWSGIFTQTGSVSVARIGASGSPLSQDGLLLLAGGENASGKLASAELYGFATVRTDKNDYAPGETVTITGHGWQPGETVNLLIHETLSPVPEADEPFTAVADAYGRILNTELVADADDVGVRFYLTASGINAQAQTTFTDAQPIRKYLAAINPTTDTAGHVSSSYTITITNDSSSDQGLGSANITVPSSYSSIALGSISAPQGKSWTVALVSGVTQLRSNANANRLSPGQTVSVNLNATTPCDAGSYTWSTTVKQSTDFSGGENFALNQPSDPAVAITGSCDAIPPTTTASGSPAANSYGWNNADVTVYLSATDNPGGSGVKQITYSAIGAQPISDTTVNASNVSIIISTEGPTTLRYFAKDNAGNSETQKTITISIDKTKPTASVTASPAANAAGWNNTDVTVSFSGSDVLSGIDSCSPQVTLATEGASQSSAPGTCTDKAGNVSDPVTKSGINIDKTKPSLTFGAPNPAANGAGWNNTSVSFPFTPHDNLSGVATTNPAASPLVLTVEGSSVTGTVTVTDVAGNSETFTSPAVKIDKTAPTISGSRSPAANAFGWNNTDVTATFACSDALSGLAAGGPPADKVVSGEGADQSVDGTCHDAAGNTASAQVTGINIDKTPPSTSVDASPAANANGWNNTDVTVSFTGSDTLSGIDSCTSPITLSTEGSGLSASGTCKDKAGNVSSQASKTGINIDKTKPTLTFGAASPAANAGGWNNTDVSFTFTSADNLSGVDTTNPASPLVLTAEGSSVTGTVTVTDKAGNSETFTSPAVKIDKTAPTITGSRSPAANAFGWNNTNVTAKFSCSDALSGLAAGSPPADTMVSGEGSNQSVDGTCHDVAGNTASARVTGISIDKTPPSTAADASPAANANGWNNTNVTVSFTGSDALSGIDSDSCTSPITLSAEGSGLSASGTCKDKAGNVSSQATKTGINIDKTKPTLTFGAASPAANAAGWNNTNVSFSFTSVDNLSGVDTTNPASPLVLTAEGLSVTGTVTVSDKAGNSETFTSPAVKIDKTAPAITGSRSPVANTFGWNNTDVTATFVCSDVISGVFSLSPAIPVVVSTEGVNQSVPGVCTDFAGNASSLVVGGISIDKTAPLLPANVLANPASIGTQGNLTAEMSDAPSAAPSKIGKAEYSINGGEFSPMDAAAGYTFPASPINVTATLPIEPVGVYSLCVRAQDLAGNESPQECILFAVYDPNGGFVTGGGWINSPAGAFTKDTSLTGKANFGFVSKYQKGATIPTGETEFQFKAGDLNFHSSAYDWLVIGGAKAQYKGSGTINGSGSYKFILTVIDGDINGGGGVDKFRIKISDTGGGLVYDNMINAPDSNDPTTVLGGGSIVIHK